MAKIFLRKGAWYRATNKANRDDIELTELIDDVAAEYPEIEVSDGGSADIPPTAYASNAEALEALGGVGKIYKTTVLGVDGIQPLLSVTI